MSVFPPELYRLIAEHLDSKRDITRLMRSSRALYHELESDFYKEIILIPAGWKHFTALAFESILQGFDRNPQRLSYISTLKILFNATIPDAQLPHLTSFLCRLPNLQYLVLETGFSDLFALLHCCNFKLQRFDYGGEDQDYLPTFLASQPHIRHLSIRFAPPTAELPLTTLPLLRILRGPSNIARALMPHRQIERLCWISSDNAYITQNGPRPAIKALKLGSTVSKDSMGNIELKSVFPNLRYFECSGQWPKVETSWSKRTELLSFLQQPHNIHTLTLVVDYEWDWEKAQVHVLELFTTVPSLQTIQFRVKLYDGQKFWRCRREGDLQDVSGFFSMWSGWLTWVAD